MSEEPMNMLAARAVYSVGSGVAGPKRLARACQPFHGIRGPRLIRITGMNKEPAVPSAMAIIWLTMWGSNFEERFRRWRKRNPTKTYRLQFVET